MTARRFLAAAALAALSASCASSESSFGPSPLIVPDAVSLPVGATQTFVVQNANVTAFSVSASNAPVDRCVRVVGSSLTAGRVQVATLARCEGRIYVTAELGAGRSPLVAAIAID